MTIILSRVAYALEGYWKNRKKEKKEKSFLIYWLKKLIPFVLKSLVLQTKKTGRCNMPPSRRIMFGCNCCYDIVGKFFVQDMSNLALTEMIRQR